MTLCKAVASNMMEIAKLKKELFEKLAKVTIKRGCGEIFEITANLFSVE